MRPFFWNTVTAFAFIFWNSFANSQTNQWLHLKIDIIGSASHQMLESADREVKEHSYKGIFLELDTPGGALDSTRSMTKLIMAASYPVIVWVGPSSARAGSAGAFLVLSSHIAAMAQGTNIGAAHPIKADGKDIPEGAGQEKVINDTIAYISALAESRGRNIEMAKSFVQMSTSITAKEALENNVIDLVANSTEQVFEKLGAKEILLPNNEVTTLSASVPSFIAYKPSLSERLLAILSNPNIFYLLFMAGIIGLGFELTHPGSMIPGVLGGISLLLALIATSVLPVSFGAMGLIVLAIALGVAEIFVPSFGILGIGGLVAFTLGSVFLVDPENTQGMRISLLAIAPSLLFIAGFGLYIGKSILKASTSAHYSGAGSLLGRKAVAKSELSPESGTVLIDGELWQATSEPGENIAKGAAVKITKRDGLVLTVENYENGKV